ncbi:MAG: insulinase family protein, partial [bacterium]|nr:insulinase family protein [bacterium]
MKKTIAIVFYLVFIITLNANAKEFSLTNGMAGNYAFSPGTGMVGIVAVVHVGVRNETAATNGISHYLEHLLFNGTRTLNQEQLYAAFDELGVYANAQTGKDYTAFMIVGRSSDLDTLFGLLREQLFFSTLPFDKFEKEKGIVEQEMLKDEQDEDYRFNTLFDLHSKSGTPYQYPTLGSRASIGAITRDQVAQYYHTWFHPNNVTLLVAADASIIEVVSAAKKQLEIVAPGDVPLASKITRVPLTRDRIIETAPAKSDANRFKAAIALPTLDSAKQQAALSAAVELFDPQEYLSGTPLRSLSFELFRDRDFSQLEISGDYSGNLDATAL